MNTQIIVAVLLIFTLIAPPQQEDIRQRSVIVTVLNADGSPAADKGMELSIREPLSRASCTTDADGRCVIQFGSNEDLVNGVLLIVGAGRQTVLFKGDSVEITIKLNESGILELHHDTHSHEPGEDDHTHPVAEFLIETAMEPTAQPVIESSNEAINQPTAEAVVEPTVTMLVVESEGQVEAVDAADPADADELIAVEPAETNKAQSWATGLLWVAVLLLIGIMGVGAWMLNKEGLWTS
ncbi:MAG: hypothetical protein AAF902_09760 [Chloroflexota bacterium]